MRRLYQFKCASTSDSKAELTAIRSRLVSVLGATRTANGRFQHSVVLFAKKSAAATANAAAAAAAAAKAGKPQKDEKSGAALTERDFYRVLLSDRPSTVYLVSLPQTTPAAAAAAGGASNALASTTAGAVLETGTGMMEILAGTGAFVQKLAVAVDGDEYAFGDFIIRVGAKFVTNKLREYVIVEIEYPPAAASPLSSSIVDTMNELFATLVSTPPTQPAAPTTPVLAAAVAAGFTIPPNTAAAGATAASSSAAASATPATTATTSNSVSGVAASSLLASHWVSGLTIPAYRTFDVDNWQSAYGLSQTHYQHHHAAVQVALHLYGM